MAASTQHQKRGKMLLIGAAIGIGIGFVAQIVILLSMYGLVTACSGFDAAKSCQTGSASWQKNAIDGIIIAQVILAILIVVVAHKMTSAKRKNT